LTIPFKARLEQFEKDNLVPNPSFEDGQVIAVESGYSFILKGWEKIGRNVIWATQESGPNSIKEVNQGKHAIKIQRKKADEIGTAEGILSELIPVIPGNYYFSYYVKFKDIASSKIRLGARLYDAVVVKVLFFDEDKQMIDPGYVNPVSGRLIDNSDKGYSFSNHWRIDDFGWAAVRGRSYHYPFSEGDIPDKTRFVRLFFGLKGTGTMWLDDIEYRYSKWNFTVLERFRPYFGRQLSLKERIIPTPKRLHRIGEITYFDVESPLDEPPLIVVSENPAPAERSAARILKKKISNVLSRVRVPKNNKTIEIRVLENKYNGEEILSKKLVFSIGRNSVYQKLQPDLPLQSICNKPQGYIIKAEQVDRTLIVFLIGETPLSNYYAATTAVQLLENDKCVYHNATVIDHPDFLGRSYVFKNWKKIEELQNDLNAVERMSGYKFNKVYMGYDRSNKNWLQPGNLYRKGIREAGELFRKGGVMRLAVMVNPYLHFPFEPNEEKLNEDLKYTWTHSRPGSFESLKGIYQIGLDAGADTLMLLSDDFVPHTGKNRKLYSLYAPEDKQRFVNLQNAQAYIINKLKYWVDSNYPGTRIEFCPPWYSNEHIDRSEGRAEVYFKELTFQVPRDVAIIWTGPTIRSLSIDMADIHRYRSLIGRWPMIWDNTLYARNIETKRYGGYTTYYPGKVRMCNLFEPYDTYRPNDFHKYNHNQQMYTNGAAYSAIYKLKYATVADYEWNTSAYNPELALWKVLCNAYGKDGARELILFNDAYYGLYQTCYQMENEGVKDEYIKTGRHFLDDLDNSFRKIMKYLRDQKQILKELDNLRQKQKKRYEKLYQIYASR
jgi:hypothetical protein